MQDALIAPWCAASSVPAFVIEEAKWLVRTHAAACVLHVQEEQMRLVTILVLVTFTTALVASSALATSAWDPVDFRQVRTAHVAGAQAALCPVSSTRRWRITRVRSQAERQIDRNRDGLFCLTPVFGSNERRPDLVAIANAMADNGGDAAAAIAFYIVTAVAERGAEAAIQDMKKSIDCKRSDRC